MEIKFIRISENILEIEAGYIYMIYIYMIYIYIWYIYDIYIYVYINILYIYSCAVFEYIWFIASNVIRLLYVTLTATPLLSASSCIFIISMHLPLCRVHSFVNMSTSKTEARPGIARPVLGLHTCVGLCFHAQRLNIFWHQGHQAVWSFTCLVCATRCRQVPMPQNLKRSGTTRLATTCWDMHRHATT